MTRLQQTKKQENINAIWCVYMHINKINNKKYIGITSRKPYERWGANGSKYKRHPVFYGAIQKYGWDNFEHIIFAENLFEEDAKRLEKILIMLFKTNCRRYKNPKYGYNLTDGGDGQSGGFMTEETRQKLREAKIGIKASEETKRKISEANKGRVVSETTRQKLSKANKGEKNYNYGKHLSDETKQKLSQALSGENNPMFGKKRSSDIVAKMVAGVKKKWEDPVYRQEVSKRCSEMYAGKNNPKAHPIVQLTLDGVFIKYWDYIGEVADYFNVNEASIRGCCSGKQKTSCGFKWMYKEDYEEWAIKNKDL